MKFVLWLGLALGVAAPSPVKHRPAFEVSEKVAKKYRKRLEQRKAREGRPLVTAPKPAKRTQHTFVARLERVEDLLAEVSIPVPKPILQHWQKGKRKDAQSQLYFGLGRLKKDRYYLILPLSPQLERRQDYLKALKGRKVKIRLERGSTTGPGTILQVSKAR